MVMWSKWSVVRFWFMLTCCSESAALTSGAEGKGFQAKAWGEIADVLKVYT